MASSSCTALARSAVLPRMASPVGGSPSMWFAVGGLAAPILDVLIRTQARAATKAGHCTCATRKK